MVNVLCVMSCACEVMGSLCNLENGCELCKVIECGVVMM